MKRRTFLTGVAAASSVVAVGGCLGYMRTSPDEYELLDGGFTDGTAWVDIEYNGDTDGKIQYKLYINDGETRIAKSDISESVELTPGESRRVTDEFGDDLVFNPEESSVGFIIYNSEQESGGDVGMVEIR